MVTGFTVSAGDGVAAPVTDSTTSIIATSVNDPPVVDLNGPAAGTDYSAIFTEDAGAVAIVANRPR